MSNLKNYLSDDEAKKYIIDLGKRTYNKNFVAGNDGNISIKVSDNEIWITPTAVSKGFMTEDMLIKVDLDGNILSGTHTPSSEMKMHLRVFKENPNVQCVVHAHPLNATTCSILALALDLPILVESIVQLGVVPLVHYCVPGTDEIPNAIAKYCNDYNAVLLSNHGALSWGETPLKAFYRMEILENYASVILNVINYGDWRSFSNHQLDVLSEIAPRVGNYSKGKFKGLDISENLEDIINNH